ncbi:hypothetical protein I2W78_06545 [Streptomyces spinoverrucosus]|uniref:hypothetical protein n=1 Tax=Streptomyces spinoverrucosus TaxID=284043 RepID=UPI0018C3BC1B|nr:hypothetical protein [Streptomyces spinoverrucosus]MBG0851514.1 hypothetical protein [Streptomyces spinoverrucosus]
MFDAEVTHMSSPDDAHAFALIEQRLAEDDPTLARRLDTLEQQFPDAADADQGTDDGRRGPGTDEAEPDEAASRETALHGDAERSWTVKVAVALAAMAGIGLLLAAILSAHADDESETSQPHGSAPSTSAPVLGDRAGAGRP